MKKVNFKKLVEEKINWLAFQYLKNKINSKGKEINYGQHLTLQSYLKPNNILTLTEQRNLFKYRVRANSLNYNMAGNGDIDLCKCGDQITNRHLYDCRSFNGNSNDNSINYDKIFNGTLMEQKKIVNILTRNTEIFEKWKHPPGSSD